MAFELRNLLIRWKGRIQVRLRETIGSETAMYPGAFGERLGRSFRLSCPPFLQTETQHGIRLAVTELRIPIPGYGVTSPMATEDAYLICLNLLEQRTHELWYEGCSVCSCAYEAGAVYIIDLRCDPITYIGDPLHSLYFYLPREALTDANTGVDGQGVTDLSVTAGQCFHDPVIASIGQALLPLFRCPGSSCQKLIDHLLHGLCAYLASEYGGAARRHEIVRGALAPWQQRLVMEIMRERVLEGVSVAELAAACGISTGALIRGFKKGTGISPHQWLLSCRLNRAMELMAYPDASLADIASNAGFSDQSHLSRVFTQRMGVTPGAWRKSLGADKRVVA